MSSVTSKLSRDTIGTIAEAHVARFRNLLAYPGIRIRRAECEHYLAIWSVVVAHNRDGVPLEDEGRNELTEALACGDYDDKLTPEELSEVEKWRNGQ